MKKRDFLLLYKAKVAGEEILKNTTGEASLYKVADVKEFVDGKPTNNIVGQKLYVLSPDENDSPLVIKVMGESKITNDLIRQKGGVVKVRCTNLVGKFYRDNRGEWTLTCIAEDAEVIE